MFSFRSIQIIEKYEFIPCIEIHFKSSANCITRFLNTCCRRTSTVRLATSSWPTLRTIEAVGRRGYHASCQRGSRFGYPYPPRCRYLHNHTFGSRAALGKLVLLANRWMTVEEVSVTASRNSAMSSMPHGVGFLSFVPFHHPVSICLFALLFWLKLDAASNFFNVCETLFLMDMQ